MNGVSYGTSKSGKPSSSAASRRPSGVSACAKPTPRPRPARSWPASRSTNARWAAGSVQVHPRREQQLAARQPRRRIGQLGDVHPADGAVEAVLTGDEPDVQVADEVAQREHLQPEPAGGLLEDRAQHGARSPRTAPVRRSAGRELDDRLAAVVGAADQPAGEDLGGEVVAQQPVALLLGERLLGRAGPSRARSPRSSPCRARRRRSGCRAASRASRANAPSLARTFSSRSSSLEHVEVGERDGAAIGCPPNVMPCQNDSPSVDERVEDAVGGDHRAHRRVGGGEALGGRDEVGLVAVALGAEPLAEPAPGADDLVGDQQHAVLVADLADALEVALGRDEAAAGVLDGLEDHARDRLGALELIRSRIASARVVGLGPRYGFVLARGAQPGNSGSNGRRAPGMPVAVSAPIVVPW